MRKWANFEENTLRKAANYLSVYFYILTLKLGANGWSRTSVWGLQSSAFTRTPAQNMGEPILVCKVAYAIIPKLKVGVWDTISIYFPLFQAWEVRRKGGMPLSFLARWLSSRFTSFCRTDDYSSLVAMTSSITFWHIKMKVLFFSLGHLTRPLLPAFAILTQTQA